MPRALISSLVLLVGCGGVEALDGGAAPDAGAADADTVDADAGAAQPPDRLGLFGPAPSLYELWLDDTGETVDRFHVGRTRTGFTWARPVVGDFDGDGVDVVAFHDPRAGTLTIAEPSGERTIPANVQRLTLAADLDGDGVDSVVGYDPSSGVTTVWVRAEVGTEAYNLILPAGGFPVAADLDGDGADTLVVLTPEGFVWVDDGGGERRAALAGAGVYPIAGDFDGDGRDGLGAYDAARGVITLWDRPESAEPGVEVTVAPANWVRVPVVGRWGPRAPRAPDVGFAFDVATPASRGVDADGLAAATAELAAIDNARAFLVLTDGALVHEAHLHGSRPEIAFNIKSVSKSLLAALVGAARADGVDLSGPVYPRFEARLHDGDPRRDQVTLAHLMTMTAGLRWSEPGIDAWIASEDWLVSALTAPVDATPGAAFNYSTGLTHVASAALSRAAGAPTDELARRLLLDPIGVRAERWDHDPQGVRIGGAEVTMRPRDLARFGQLMLDDGVVDGARVLPEGARDAILTEHVPASAIDGDLSYGLWWWRRDFGGTPAWFAWGYGGQLVILFEAARTVVVLTARSDVTGDVASAVAYQLFDVVSDHVVPALP